jgi:inosine-uridine nucleoside N-ribohydrolase
MNMKVCTTLWFQTFCAALLLATALPLTAQTTTERQKVILDTDFRLPPQDDGIALMLAIKAPNLDLLGVTTVAGNGTVQEGTAYSLRELEIAGRTDVAVYPGSNRPLVHDKPDWTKTWHGNCCWNIDEPAEAHKLPPPPGGFAQRQPEKESAVDFIIHCVEANPHQVTIMAVGPLTNVAMAIRQEPGLAQKIKQIAIMGGAIGNLPNGAGNAQPNAEFNFWVDPEAAHVVLRSGVPIVLTPLNVTSQTHFSKEWFEKLVAANNPLTNLMKQLMQAEDHGGLHDELAVAAVIDPSVVETKKMFVDVDINHGPAYGESVGWIPGENENDIWQGAEGAQQISVNYQVDNEKFLALMYKLLTSEK